MPIFVLDALRRALHVHAPWTCDARHRIGNCMNYQLTVTGRGAKATRALTNYNPRGSDIAKRLNKRK